MLSSPNVTKAEEYFDKFVEEESSRSNNYLERCIAYYTRGRFKMGRRRPKQALHDVKMARQHIECDVRGGATAFRPIGLSEAKLRERETDRNAMHFKVYAQMYLLYIQLGNTELASNRYKMAINLANKYKLVEPLIDFLLFNASEKSQAGNYAEADKLFKEAYGWRNRPFGNKEDKKSTMFTLYFDWARNEVSVLNINRALDLAKEAYYIKPKNSEVEWLVKALILFQKLKSKSDQDLSVKEQIINLESIGDLYFELFLRCNEVYTKCVIAASGKYDAILKLSKDNNHLAKIHSTLGHMYDRIGDVDQMIESYSFALSESSKLDYSLEYLNDMVESMIKVNTNQTTVLTQLKNAEVHFKKDKPMLCRYLELLKKTKENFGEETINEAMRLTELEDYYPGVQVCCDHGDDIDINSQIEDISIPKQERESKSVDRNHRNQNGETLLQQKICQMEHTRETEANVRVIKDLINKGYSVNVYDNAGLTPLHEAANFGFPTIAKILLDHGADINAMTRNLSFQSTDLKVDDLADKEAGRITPLQDACSTLDGEFVKIMIDKLNVIEILLNYNANTLFRNRENKTPLQCFTEQRQSIISDKNGYDYKKVDNPKIHLDKLQQISQYLSRKTAEQQKDAQFRAKTATIIHVPDVQEQAKEVRSNLRNTAVSRGDRLMQLERQSVLPLHEKNQKEMTEEPNQPSILNNINGLNRRGSPQKRSPKKIRPATSPRKAGKRRCFIDDENVVTSKPPKIIRIDEEESFLNTFSGDDRLGSILFLI